MKNLCIVTVYNSINSGSYWQAKALGEYLARNNNVFYLKRKDIIASSHCLMKIKRVLRPLIRLKIRESFREYEIVKRFSMLEKGFNTVCLKNIEKANIDCVVLGSDTIWNLNNNYFSKNYRKYFGGVFGKKRVITYAPSVANTTIAKFRERPDITRMLKDIKSISVRDQKTAEIVNGLIGINPVIVCDPVMLLTKEEYLGKAKRRLIKDKFIFLYLFENLSKKQIRQLSEFAKINDLKIVSGAKYLDYADDCFVNAPDLFLQNMIDAEYVITDTFHGTLFSILLNKHFVVINRNKDKVIDLLNKFQLKERIVSDERIDVKLQSNINFEKINEDISEMRKTSIKYLKDSINKG